ncbi:hypothetical protein H0H93_013164 [Arthromyces matolae]|nr:hypothetical protein H0H93_013164 [Arthromyces matolae]
MPMPMPIRIHIITPPVVAILKVFTPTLVPELAGGMTTQTAISGHAPPTPRLPFEEGDDKEKRTRNVLRRRPSTLSSKKSSPSIPMTITATASAGASASAIPTSPKFPNIRPTTSPSPHPSPMTSSHPHPYPHAYPRSPSLDKPLPPPPPPPLQFPLRPREGGRAKPKPGYGSVQPRRARGGERRELGLQLELDVDEEEGYVVVNVTDESGHEREESDVSLGKTRRKGMSSFPSLTFPFRIELYTILKVSFTSLNL